MYEWDREQGLPRAAGRAAHQASMMMKMTMMLFREFDWPRGRRFGVSLTPV